MIKVSDRKPFHRGDVKSLRLPKGREGHEILNDPLFNKGTAFEMRERDRLGIRGMLPTVVVPIETQLLRIYEGYHRAGSTSKRDQKYNRKENKVAKHLFLMALQDRNETLFYRLLVEHIREMAPIVYTPVVGYACKNAGTLYRKARGLYLSGHTDLGDFHSIVANWDAEHVDVIVITDGSRVLGLGDLGVHGQPIPVGKLSLYVAAGGIHPTRCLPIIVDMGTNNKKLREDPLYLGEAKSRLEGDEYVEAMDEIMDALITRWPNALIQFEDIKTPYAEFLLQRYRHKMCMFNDDVQGTGTMTLAGVLTALRIKQQKPSDIKKQRIVCLGSGSAGIGVCNSLAMGMMEEGMTEEEAMENFWMVDVEGLLTTDRDNLVGDQEKFARSDAKNVQRTLQEVIALAKPTVLLGLSGCGGAFTEEVVREFGKYDDQPILFAMSNPTDMCECTAQQAYDWTDGRAIFASGSPFDDVVDANGNVLMHPSQSNNMFVFPGVGLGVVSSQAKFVSDSMLYAAAKALVNAVPEANLKQNNVFPDIENIREVSKQIAIEVARTAEQQGLARNTLDNLDYDTWEEYVAHRMFYPDYLQMYY